MDEVPIGFAISDIQGPPVEMKGRVHASCIKSSIIYGSRIMPLIDDDGEILIGHMQIRWEVCRFHEEHAEGLVKN